MFNYLILIFFNTINARKLRRDAAHLWQSLGQQDMIYIFLMYNLLQCLVFSLSRGEYQEQRLWHWGTRGNKQLWDYQMLLSLREPREPFIASSHQMVMASGCWHQGTPNSNR